MRLTKSSTKSGQRRSGPSNLSWKTRQSVFPTELEINRMLLLKEAKGFWLPMYTKLYVASVHNGHLHCSQREQRIPGSCRHLPEGTADPKLPSYPNPAEYLSEGTWYSWNKELLGGTAHLAKNIQLPHLACGVEASLGMSCGLDCLTVWLQHSKSLSRHMTLGFLLLEAHEPGGGKEKVEAS